MNLQKNDEFACWDAIQTAEAGTTARRIKGIEMMLHYEDQRSTPERVLKGRTNPSSRVSTYVFAHFNRGLFARVTFSVECTPFVRFGGFPARIDDTIFPPSGGMTDGLVRVGGDFKRGDPVIIEYGPFKSLIGIFERDVGEAERIRILLTSINYQAHITIEKDNVIKVPSLCSKSEGLDL